MRIISKTAFDIKSVGNRDFSSKSRFPTPSETHLTVRLDGSSFLPLLVDLTGVEPVSKNQSPVLLRA